MSGSIAGYLAAADVMARPNSGYFYDNSWRRCQIGWHGRDCSCFCNFCLANAGYQNVGQCNNSFINKTLCVNAVRPVWFTQRFGVGQGTLITKAQAMTVICWGFEDTGGGHQETILGQVGGSTRSVGAHSHATGIGYDANGINNHNLQSFAVPVQFLPEMALKIQDPATVAALKALSDWATWISAAPLKKGDRNAAVATMIDLLILHHFMARGQEGDAFGDDAQTGVYKFKRAYAVGNEQGDVFGGTAAETLLHAA